MEEEWKTWERVVSCAKEVCGVRKLGSGKQRQGSEWWNEEVLVREKNGHTPNICRAGRVEGVR